jgi:toxin FitB
MIVLDTNVVSEMMKAQPNSAVRLWLDRQMEEHLFLAATSLAELRLGVEILPQSKRRIFLNGLLEGIIERMFGDRVLAFDARAARVYGEVVGRARLSGRAIGVADGQIAAIAQVHGLSVATRDVGPFEAVGIRVIDPWTA